MRSGWFSGSALTMRPRHEPSRPYLIKRSEPESIAARFEALAELREEGLIRHLGLSNVDTGHLTEARAITRSRLSRTTTTPRTAPTWRCWPPARRRAIAFAPFFPLGGGCELDDDRLAMVAARHRASVAQIGLAWLLASSPVTLAIPGTGSVRHLEEHMATESVALSDEHLADLADLAGPRRRPACRSLSTKGPSAMKLLVLGATGLTGRHVVDVALRSGDSVTAFVRDPAALADLADRVTLATGDATSLQDLSATLPGHDAVISALGAGNSLTSVRADDLFTRSTTALLAAAKETGVSRLVWLSSFGVGHTLAWSSIPQKMISRRSTAASGSTAAP
ncbi:aldo/keto reductase [Streptomyces mirabilis]|uniref:aldo/keto reductase n=1 Tax=Streptomyces mirabilis TaxID=68239 RepID=UPI003654EC31